MTLKDPKQFHPKNIPFQIRSLGTRSLFFRLHTKIIVEILVFFDTAEKKFSSYAPRLITIYFVIMLLRALKYHKQHDAE
jgi:hypothetical protein